MSAGREVESKLHAMAVTWLKIPCLSPSSPQNSSHCQLTQLFSTSTFCHISFLLLCQRPQKFSVPCQMHQTLLVPAAAETLYQLANYNGRPI